MAFVSEEIYLEDYRKFKKMGREYFQFSSNSKFDPIQESQIFHKLFHFKMPEDLSETFLTPKNVSLYLLDYYKVHAKTEAERFKSQYNIRDTVLRWLYSKSLQEKESAIFYLLKLSKVKRLDNFDLLLILSHLVCERRGDLYDEIIEKKFEECQKFDPSDSFFFYFFYLLKGFYAMDKQQWEEALFEFDNLENSSPNHINASFYRTICFLKLGQAEQAEKHVSVVVNYDVKRVRASIDSLSKNAFRYFVKNSFMRNFFLYEESVKISKYFVSILEETKNMSRYFDLTTNVLTEINDKKWDEYKNHDIVQKLAFLKEILEDLRGTNSYLHQTSLHFVKDIVFDVTRLVRQNIVNKFEKKVGEKLHIYEERVNYIQDTKREAENEKTEFNHEQDISLKKSIDEFEKQIKSIHDDMEKKLEYLEKNTPSDAMHSFKNALMYNSIFAFFVLLLAGFADYSNNYISDLANVSLMLSAILVGGIKWGAISFILGIFLSLFIFVNTYFERYSQKNDYIKRISNLTIEKENGINALKKSSEEKKKIGNLRFESRLKQIEKDLEVAVLNRETERARLEAQNENELKELTDPLDKLLVNE